TKSGTSSFHGEGYYYLRDSKFAANDRSNTALGQAKQKASYKYPGFNVGGPIFFGDKYTKNKDKLFFFFAYEWQRQNVDPGSRLSRTFTPAMKAGDFSAFLGNQGSNLNMGLAKMVGLDAKGQPVVIQGVGPDGKPVDLTLAPGQMRIPFGFPNAGQPVPNNNMAPYMSSMGKYLASLYPDANYNDPTNLYNYIYHQPEPQNRDEMKMR